MKTVLCKKNCLRGISTCLLLCIVFLVLGSLPLMAGDSTTLGSPGGTLSGYTSKNVSGGTNYVYYPTPGTYNWTIPDEAASKVWVTLAAAGSGGVGECCYYCCGSNGSDPNTGCVTGTSMGGVAGGLVNKQEVSVVPGSAATITVGYGGGGVGVRGWSYAYPNNSGTTAGGNTCFSSSTGTVCATGGSISWWQPYCNTSATLGGPTLGAGAAGGGVSGGGSGGWARIEW